MTTRRKAVQKRTHSHRPNPSDVDALAHDDESHPQHSVDRKPLMAAYLRMNLEREKTRDDED